MNEQELPNLYSMLKWGNVTLASDSNPRIAIVLGIVEILQSKAASVCPATVLEHFRPNAPALPAVGLVANLTADQDRRGTPRTDPAARAHAGVPGHYGKARLAVEEHANRSGEGIPHCQSARVCIQMDRP